MPKAYIIKDSNPSYANARVLNCPLWFYHKLIATKLGLQFYYYSPNVNPSTWLLDCEIVSELPDCGSYVEFQDNYLPSLSKVEKRILEEECLEEGISVSSNRDLVFLRQKIQRYINFKHLENGVDIYDPSSTFIGPLVSIGKATIIMPNNEIYGETTIGEDNVLESGNYIQNMTIGNGNTLISSHLVNSVIGSNNIIGPYARLRSHTTVTNDCTIGNFVEIKGSLLKSGSKSKHLAYIGDTNLGKNVNIGCGVALANYDGITKHKTTIQDDCFIGCNVTLVSPLTLHAHSYVGAGSVITEDVMEGDLAIARVRQINKPQYALRKRTHH